MRWKDHDVQKTFQWRYTCSYKLDESQNNRDLKISVFGVQVRVSYPYPYS